jgi:hypothetical protein
VIAATVPVADRSSLRFATRSIMTATIAGTDASRRLLSALPPAAVAIHLGGAMGLASSALCA